MLRINVLFQTSNQNILCSIMPAWGPAGVQNFSHLFKSNSGGEATSCVQMWTLHDSNGTKSEWGCFGFCCVYFVQFVAFSPPSNLSQAKILLKKTRKFQKNKVKKAYKMHKRGRMFCFWILIVGDFLRLPLTSVLGQQMPAGLHLSSVWCALHCLMHRLYPKIYFCRKGFLCQSAKTPKMHVRSERTTKETKRCLSPNHLALVRFLIFI